MTGRKIKIDDTRPPQSPKLNRLWFDQALGKMRRWDGKEWIEHVPGALSSKINGE